MQFLIKEFQFFFRDKKLKFEYNDDNTKHIATLFVSNNIFFFCFLKHPISSIFLLFSKRICNIVKKKKKQRIFDTEILLQSISKTRKFSFTMQWFHNKTTSVHISLILTKPEGIKLLSPTWSLKKFVARLSSSFRIPEVTKADPRTYSTYPRLANGGIRQGWAARDLCSGGSSHRDEPNR